MVNGFSGIFMVASISAVPGIRKTDRDARQSLGPKSKKDSAGSLFARILKETTQETTDDAMDCRTTTYGRDSKMQEYLHKKREYHY